MKKPPPKTKNRSVNYLQGFWLDLFKEYKPSLRSLKKPRIITIRIRWVLVGLVLLNAYGNHGHKIVYSQPQASVSTSPLKHIVDTPLKPQEAAQPAVVPQAVVYTPPTPKPAVGVVNCGDNIYKQYIYSHESGCNTASINSIGCAGIGQACPGSKLPCSLSDFACQDAFFTSYANSRYGGWAGAYSAWVAQGWW